MKGNTHSELFTMSRFVNVNEFNELVQDMINEYHTSREEAVRDVIKKLRVQGVGMNNVLNCVGVELLPPEDVGPIEESLSRLEDIVERKEDKDRIIKEINFLYESCKKTISHKVFIGISEFVRIAIGILSTFPEEKEIIITVFKCLIYVTTDQPDILKESDALRAMSNYLEKEKDEKCLTLLLIWMKSACISNEGNRQRIVEAGGISHLHTTLENFKTSPSIVQGVCSVFRSLVLDDDSRVEFGHHQEHARQIGEIALITLTKLLKIYRTEKETLGELLITMTSVINRNEFCDRIFEYKNGESISYILDAFSNYPDCEKLSRQALKLIRVLAGNDKVRGEIVKAGAAPLIVSSMFKHQCSPASAAFGNACVAALTLRNVTNSKAFAEVEAPLAIVEGMRTHPRNLSVQKQGCRAIRNMVSRCRDICPTFLELGAEDLINSVLRDFPAQCDFDAKAALRDLGCQVEYLEDWFGGGCGEGSKS